MLSQMAINARNNIAALHARIAESETQLDLLKRDLQRQHGALAAIAEMMNADYELVAKAEESVPDGD